MTTSCHRVKKSYPLDSYPLRLETAVTFKWTCHSEIDEGPPLYLLLYYIHGQGWVSISAQLSSLLDWPLGTAVSVYPDYLVGPQGCILKDWGSTQFRPSCGPLLMCIWDRFTTYYHIITFFTTIGSHIIPIQQLRKNTAFQSHTHGRKWAYTSTPNQQV